MRIFKRQNNNGFVILFAIIAASIILTVAFGISNIALKELSFSASAKDTNEAFYAADMGSECAFINDKVSSISFLPSGGSGSVTCLGSTIPFTASSATSWSFTLSGLGASGQSCAKVTVTKNFSTNPVTTNIDSKGYNKGDSSCVSTAVNRLERNIKVTYGGDTTSNTAITLFASPSNVDPGSNVTVTFTGVPIPTVRDYIGRYLASAGNPTAEQDYSYTSGSPTCSKTAGGSAVGSGSCTFTMPMTPENYNFRLFSNDNVNSLLATSNTVVVNAPIVNYTLAVNRTGTGSGLVTSGASEINCGSTCSANFGSGSSVTLTATSNLNSAFTGWSGGGCSGSAPTCVVTMSGAQNVTATFTAQSTITYVGRSSATGTTVALPAHQAGDLILIFAFRDGSITPPSLPAGWTDIGTAGGANTASSRLGYFVATSGSTTSGTWTSATEVEAQVYRGVNSTNPIGSNGDGGNSNSSVVYPALTMQVTANTSWVAGFAGHRSTNTTLETAPTGMTARTTLLDATAEVSGHDTNGSVSSWSAQTVSVGGTASGWRARTVEILSQ